MAVRNGGFETADPADPGLAEDWQLLEAGVMERGDFAHVGAPSRPIETFDGWYADIGAAEVSDVEIGNMTDGEQVEDHEEGWGSLPSTILSLEQGLFTGGGDVEGFEDGWNIEPSADEGIPSLEQGLFTGGGDVEGFETGWSTFPDAVTTTEAGIVGAPEGVAAVMALRALLGRDPEYFFNGERAAPMTGATVTLEAGATITVDAGTLGVFNRTSYESDGTNGQNVMVDDVTIGDLGVAQSMALIWSQTVDVAPAVTRGMISKFTTGGSDPNTGWRILANVAGPSILIDPTTGSSTTVTLTAASYTAGNRRWFCAVIDFAAALLRLGSDTESEVSTAILELVASYANVAPMRFLDVPGPTPPIDGRIHWCAIYRGTDLASLISDCNAVANLVMDADTSGTGIPAGVTIETFEGAAAPVSCFVDPVADTILTAAPHGLIPGDVVHLENEGGTLPEGLQPDVPYYVHTVAAEDEFTVKPQPNASTAQDIADFGTGQHRYVRDKTRYWISRGLL